MKAVCFFPRYYVHPYYGKTSYTMMQMRNEIMGIIDLGSMIEEQKLADGVASLRMQQKPDGSYIDNNYTLLIFYTTTSVPEWFYIDNLEPSKIDGSVVCAGHNDDVWLIRKFDHDGAWVEAELPEI